MNLPPIDRSAAQDLLTKLVQVLSPLTVHPIPPSFFLDRRFSIPPSHAHEEAFTQRASVRLLPALHAIQQEVEELVKEGKPAARPLLQESVSLIKQAKELIHQVQEALGQLSNPKEASLMKTLRELKPKLDRIIEAVAEHKPIEREKEYALRADPRPVTLPSAPIPFEPKRFILNRKKKQRKGFWFKES